MKKLMMLSAILLSVSLSSAMPNIEAAKEKLLAYKKTIVTLDDQRTCQRGAGTYHKVESAIQLALATAALYGKGFITRAVLTEVPAAAVSMLLGKPQGQTGRVSWIWASGRHPRAIPVTLKSPFFWLVSIAGARAAIMLARACME